MGDCGVEFGFAHGTGDAAEEDAALGGPEEVGFVGEDEGIDEDGAGQSLIVQFNGTIQTYAIICMMFHRIYRTYYLENVTAGTSRDTTIEVLVGTARRLLVKGAIRILE